MAAAMLAAGLLASPAAAVAQAMADPTRPPEGVVSAESEEDAVRLPVLQSVIIAQHKRSAIIDGRLVEIGSRVGDARVVEITERRVTLRAGGQRQVLHLFPEVEIEGVRSTRQSGRQMSR